MRDPTVQYRKDHQTRVRKGYSYYEVSTDSKTNHSTDRKHSVHVFKNWHIGLRIVRSA